MFPAAELRPAPPAPPAPAPLAVYVHWPFCASKCPYCDFNSHVRDRIDETAYGEALLAELEWERALTGPRRLESVFFGGGTPSLMAPETVARVIEAARRLWTPAPGLEITLEANPSSVERARFRAYAQAGVNRVSVGVQALNDVDLRYLGRRHDAAEARRALQTAHATFERVSFDLIYARPGQTPAAWRRELAEALTLAGDHLSAYQLTIEPGTAFHTAFARGEFALPDEDEAVALYELTDELLAVAGFEAYEVSNHARPGARSRHNLAYWRYGDYVGVGPGAHGRVGGPGAKHATRRHRAPEVWLARVGRDGHARTEARAIPPDEQVAEALMMGLRLSEGIPLARLEALAGATLDATLPADRLDALIAEGDLRLGEGRLRATATGRRRLNAVLAYLLG